MFLARVCDECPRLRYCIRRYWVCFWRVFELKYITGVREKSKLLYRSHGPCFVLDTMGLQHARRLRRPVWARIARHRETDIDRVMMMTNDDRARMRGFVSFSYRFTNDDGYRG